MSDSSSAPAEQPTDTPEAPEAGTVPIVALGASAGGVQALEAFFDALPADTGMAFVVLMHLSPDHGSNLAEILQHHTPLTVKRIEDGMAPAPNTVYVLPPKAELGLSGGRLQLKAGPPPHEQRTVIDVFLRALVADRGEEAIGIVLSGTGTDGTEGMKALKEAGGFTMVQDPEEAEHDGMPQSAIDTGLIDVVAPVGELAADLVPYWTHAAQVARPDDEEAWPEADEEQEQVVLKILAQVYAGTGHDFSGYKRSTVMRRLARRLTVNRQSKLVDYLELLREDPEETRALFQELLISVTRFFRDPGAFAALEETIIPTLFEGKGATEQVRVWSVGCATGEEAYSLAMLLHEQAEQMDRPPELQVFATDLSGPALETARQGLYPESVAADLTPERVQRYLVPEGTHYRVHPVLREMVLFANHNLLGDPPFSKLDLVSSRNLLIYLNREMQKSAFNLFHYALRPGGVLFLGASESIAAAGGLFSALDKEHSIYQRQPSPREDRPPLFPLKEKRAAEGRLSAFAEKQQEPERVDALHQRLLLEEVASIVVDEGYAIVHLTSPAARYLEYQGGAPTHHVLEVAPQTLRMELRSGLYQAFQKGRATEHRWVRTNAKEETEYVKVRVRPVRDGRAFAQIILTEMDAPPSELDVGGKGDESSSEYVVQLEEELKKTKEQLQVTVEEYETTTEEMEASNEELLSMNEELQSKNEEVETSKEELQSVNEELKTTNQELQSKIEELRRTNSDLHNLMEATNIATLFLDRQLQIERFTPRVNELFNIRPADVGRPLSDFTQRFASKHLIEDAQTVLDDLQPIEKELHADKDAWFLVRLRPYRTVNDRIDGVVITFVEITERKQAEQELREREERFRDLVNTSANVIYRMNPDWSVLHELDGQGFIADTKQPTEAWMDMYIHPDDQPKVEAAIEEAIRTQSMCELEHRVRRPDGTLGWVHARAVPLFDDDGALVEWFGAASDITDRVEAKQHLQWERDFIDRVLETVGALIAVIDPDGRIVRFNRKCEVVSGYDAEEAEGQNVFDLLVPAEEQEGIREVIERHHAGEDHVTHENHWITKEGDERLIRWSNTVLRDDEGQVQKLIGTGIDVTERRQLERQVVNVSDEERRRIGQDLHDMLASQLAGIAMMVRSLAGKVEAEEPVTTEDLHRVAELISDSGGQARALSHSLMPLEVQGERLAEGLRHLAKRQETMRADISCTFETGEAIPPLEGEVASHLYRIASEAVGNAIKHADPGAIAIRLAVEDGQLVLTVRDDGMGIPDHTEPTDGLGLHMMQYRAELIGANLTVEPAAEGGTVMQCRLPLRRATQDDEPQAG
ncbi:MAG: PAS domain S-box protein [Bacteroidetes bacterium]|jgi:two-component system CheB/CheR fusion protein|nr:PAS domain S-box protein [Bacteroidota bacterium]